MKACHRAGLFSPLLANVYLHEFDQWAEAKWQVSQYEKQKIRKAGGGNFVMVRYADDFVVLSNGGIEEVRKAKQEIKAYLEGELLSRIEVRSV